MADLAATAPILDSWSVREVASFPCSPGYGICVSARLSIVIVSTWPENCLKVYDMHTGTFRNRIAGSGRGRGRLHFTLGDMCTHPPDASNDTGFPSTFAEANDVVVVADSYNNRLSQFNVHTGAWIRHIGEAELGAMDERSPKYVACTMRTVVAMSDWRCSVFDWDTGRRLYFVTAPTEDPFYSSLRLTVAKTDDGTACDLLQIVATTRRQCRDTRIVVMIPSSANDTANVSSLLVEAGEYNHEKTASGGINATDTASSSFSQVFVTSWHDNVYRVLLPLIGQGGAVQIQHVPLPGALTHVRDVKSCASGLLYTRTRDRVHVFCESRLRLYWIWIAATLHTTIEIL